jgi:hypothetical protein
LKHGEPFPADIVTDKFKIGNNGLKIWRIIMLKGALVR